MGKIPDAAIHTLVIPASHNSHTYRGGWLPPVTSFVRCQSRTVKQQMECGIRALDFRVHSKTHCAHDGFPTIPIREGLAQIVQFLQENPTEVAFVCAKPDYCAKKRKNDPLTNERAENYLKSLLTESVKDAEALDWVDVPSLVNGGAWCTLGDLVKQGTRIVLVFNKVCSSWGVTRGGSPDAVVDKFKGWCCDVAADKDPEQLYWADYQTTFECSDTTATTVSDFCQHACLGRDYRWTAQQLAQRAHDRKLIAPGKLAEANFIGLNHVECAQVLIGDILEYNLSEASAAPKQRLS